MPQSRHEQSHKPQSQLRGDAPVFVPYQDLTMGKKLQRSDSSSSLFSVFKGLSMPSMPGRRQRRDSNASTRTTALAEPAPGAGGAPQLSAQSRMYQQVERAGSSLSLFLPKTRAKKDPDAPTDALQRRRKLAAGFMHRAVAEKPEVDDDAASIKSTSSRFRALSQKFRRAPVADVPKEEEEEDDTVPAMLPYRIRTKASSSMLRQGQKAYGDDPETSMQLFKALHSVDDLRHPGFWTHSNASAIQIVDQARKVSAGSSVSAASDVSNFNDEASSVTTVDSTPGSRNVSGVKPVGGVCWIGESGSKARPGRAWDYFGDDSEDEEAHAHRPIRSRVVVADGHRHSSSNGSIRSGGRSVRSSGHDWILELEKDSLRVACV